tara:strand:+ start:647 stop:844 length:198 start_codon:yes stop_codon:yes gene_type:complete
MKPQSIRYHERMDVDTTLQSKKMSIDTPIGKIESDSGSHLIDVLSIVIIIAAFYYLKRLFSTAKN